MLRSHNPVATPRQLINALSSFNIFNLIIYYVSVVPACYSGKSTCSALEQVAVFESQCRYSWLILKRKLVGKTRLCHHLGAN